MQYISQPPAIDYQVMFVYFHTVTEKPLNDKEDSWSNARPFCNSTVEFPDRTKISRSGLMQGVPSKLWNSDPDLELGIGLGIMVKNRVRVRVVGFVA